MKRVVCLIVAVFACFCSVFALDGESASFDAYSFDPLTMSALDYGVSLASATSWDTSDQKMLADIRNAFYASGSGAISSSLLGNIASIESNFDELINILDWSPSGTFSTLGEFILEIRNALTTSNAYTAGSLVYNVSKMTDLLDTLNRVTVPYGNNLLDLIYTDVSDVEDYLSVISSNSISSNSAFADLLKAFGNYAYYPRWMGNTQQTTYAWPTLMGNLYSQLTTDGLAPFYADKYTLYTYVKRLSETLATEDDRLLAEAQKDNREEIEDSFLSGSSGSTSLGASDFGDLSDVGGTVKDSISLNGQASVSSFTSGLAGADESGQGWFSAATRDSLDSVSSSVSTFSMDDPYNMSGWYERYAWVEGD